MLNIDMTKRYWHEWSFYNRKRQDSIIKGLVTFYEALESVVKKIVSISNKKNTFWGSKHCTKWKYSLVWSVREADPQSSVGEDFGFDPIHFCSCKFHSIT